MGGTGDPPVPVGDSPTGTERLAQREHTAFVACDRACRSSRRVAGRHRPVAGQWLVLPQSQFSNRRLTTQVDSAQDSDMVETTKKPTFLGQAMLIVLPVLVLLLVGLTSLRQDKILAHREAAQGARRLAEVVLAESEATIGSTRAEAQEMELPAFQVDAAGHPLFPPPVAPRLIPRPLLASALTKEQRGLWHGAQASEARGNDPAAIIEAWQTFLSLEPPADFAANATYSLGLLQAVRGERAAAVQLFQRAVGSHPDALTESGLPLRPLAELKRMEKSSNGFIASVRPKSTWPGKRPGADRRTCT